MESDYKRLIILILKDIDDQDIILKWIFIMLSRHKNSEVP